MGGGQWIVYGLLLILAALVGVTSWGCWTPLCYLVAGSIPPLLIIVGAVFLLLGFTDWRSARAEAAGAGAGTDQS